MFRAPSSLVAALALVVGATAAAAQIPGTYTAAPTVTLQAQKAESFSMTVSSTVQATPLTIADSTAGASQTYTGNVTLTPTWDLASGRVVTIYGYVSSQFSTGTVTFANSLLEASATGGTGTANGSWNAFGSTVNSTPSAVQLTQVTASGANLKVTGAGQALTVGLRLNTTATHIQPGTYTGVVTFAALIQ